MATQILYCSNCKVHEFQDMTYGHKMRVHNFAPKAKSFQPHGAMRCVVCGSEKSAK